MFFRDRACFRDLFLKKNRGESTFVLKFCSDRWDRRMDLFLSLGGSNGFELLLKQLLVLWLLNLEHAPGWVT